MIRPVACLLAAVLIVPSPQAPSTGPVRGLTAAAEVSRAYDAILDADFAAIAGREESTCGLAAHEVCDVLEALALWWSIALEPESRLNDVRFSRTVDEAIASTAAWTEREPARAEAWFYLGVAYGTRVQWRVLRKERLAAARDGKQIKMALERARLLDPAMHDADFGIGMYRYYADVAPAALRLLRWMLLLPGGNREEGLRQMQNARDNGRLVRGEADYQLHLIYLWYENRSREALAIIRDLQTRYPRNPLFHHLEAEIVDVYFHDHAASLAASTRLLALTETERVNEPTLASVRARLNMAIQLNRLGQRTRAIDLLATLAAEKPTRPHGATMAAQSLLKRISAR